MVRLLNKLSVLRHLFGRIPSPNLDGSQGLSIARDRLEVHLIIRPTIRPVVGQGPDHIPRQDRGHVPGQWIPTGGVIGEVGRGLHLPTVGDVPDHPALLAGDCHQSHVRGPGNILGTGHGPGHATRLGPGPRLADPGLEANTVDSVLADRGTGEAATAVGHGPGQGHGPEVGYDPDREVEGDPLLTEENETKVWRGERKRQRSSKSGRTDELSTSVISRGTPPKRNSSRDSHDLGKSRELPSISETSIQKETTMPLSPLSTHVMRMPVSKLVTLRTEYSMISALEGGETSVKPCIRI